MRTRVTPWAVAALGVVTASCARPELSGPAPQRSRVPVLSESSLQLLEDALRDVRPGALVIRRRFEPERSQPTCPMPVMTTATALPMPIARPVPGAVVPMPTDTNGCRNPLFRKPE